MMLASVFDDPTVGIRVQMLVMLPLMLFSGFFLNNANIPSYFIWIQYISPIKYAFSGAMIAVFQNLSLNCTVDELVNISIPIHLNYSLGGEFSTSMDTNFSMGNFPFPSNFSNYGNELVNYTYLYNTSICPVTSGDTIINQLDIDVSLQWLNITILVVMFVVTNLISYLSIAFCKRVK